MKELVSEHLHHYHYLHVDEGDIRIDTAENGTQALRFSDRGTTKAQIQYKDNGETLNILTGGSTNAIEITNTQNVKFSGPITASGNISASGNIIGELTGIGGAVTGITSLLATDIKIGEDDETKIDFETANEIHFYANNVEQVYLADNIFGPQSDSDVDLGSSGVRWKDSYFDTATTRNLTTTALLRLVMVMM